jgi:hypothetical protein
MVKLFDDGALELTKCRMFAGNIPSSFPFISSSITHSPRFTNPELLRVIIWQENVGPHDSRWSRPSKIKDSTR